MCGAKYDLVTVVALSLCVFVFKIISVKITTTFSQRLCGIILARHHERGDMIA